MSTNLLNGENILRKVYDPPTESLKTNVTAVIPPGTITVAINDVDDSIKIGDGTGSFLDINPDGSINVVVSDASGLVTKNSFNEVTNVASGVETVVLGFVAPTATKLMSANFSGTNIAAYTVYINGIAQAKVYTYFQCLSDGIDFKDGISLTTGDVVQVKVLHNRPDVGDFNSNIIFRN